MADRPGDPRNDFDATWDAIHRVRDERDDWKRQWESAVEDIALLQRSLSVYEQALRAIAENPCQVFPSPGPTRDVNDRLVWPSNCITQKRPPCQSCVARAALTTEPGPDEACGKVAPDA